MWLNSGTLGQLRSQLLKSAPVGSCLAKSRPVRLRWVISGQIRSWWVHSGHVRSTRVTSGQVTSRQILLCHIKLSGHVGSQQITSRSIQGQVNSRFRQASQVNTGQIGNVGSSHVVSGYVRSSWVMLVQFKSCRVKSGQIGASWVTLGQLRSRWLNYGHDGSMLRWGHVLSSRACWDKMGHIRTERVMLGPFRSCQIMSGHIRLNQVTLGQNRLGQGEYKVKSGYGLGQVSWAMSSQIRERWVNSGHIRSCQAKACHMLLSHVGSQQASSRSIQG